MAESNEPILGVERAYFNDHRAELLKSHSGKFALIKARELIGVFDTAEEAYGAGLGLLGNVPMLIAQVVPEDPVLTFPALQLGLIGAAVQV